MIRIRLNRELLEKHISKIAIKIRDNINTIERDGLDENIVSCLDYLLIDNNVKSILEANTTELKNIISYFTESYPNSIDNSTELNRILRDEIFGKEYTNWSKRTTYGAYSFVKELGLNSCPYCNRNYTFVVDDSQNGKLRPEIDHFYPKSIYPFLAMSFYNLIPSCTICNHTKNATVKEGLENPYDLTDNSYTFTYKPKNVDFVAVEKEKYNFDSFEIGISGNQSNIELFKLEELYKQHKDVVLELLIKKVYYPKSYIEELSKFGFGQDEIYRYLFSNYNQDDDLHKRPLSKLIKDISTELGLV